MDQYDYLLRAIVVGDSGVGKSSLILRFADNIFAETYVCTIGVDFRIKTVDVQGKWRCKLQIWDTAGQDRFRTIVASYYRGAQAALFVFDVNNRETFDDLREWIAEVQRYNSVVFGASILVGNKCDMPTRMRQVSRSDAQALAAEFGMTYLETSAKDEDDSSVVAAFSHLAERGVNVQRSLVDNKKRITTATRTTTVRPGGAPAYNQNCCTLL